MRDFSKSIRVGNEGSSFINLFGDVYKYPSNFDMRLSENKLKIYKNNKFIGEAKTHYDALKIIEQNGGKVTKSYKS